MEDIEFDKSKILYGNKKRFLEFSENKFFCFYDGFGGQDGKIIKKKDFLYWEDYKYASISEVDAIIDEIQYQMSFYKKKLEKIT